MEHFKEQHGLTMSRLLEITIDTSVVAEEDSTLQYLIDAHQKNFLDVAVAGRFKMDKENDTARERVERHQKIVAQLNFVASTFRIGTHDYTGEIGVLADDELHQQLFCLFDIDPNTRSGRHSQYDVDHMYSHLIKKRGFFLTYENKILKKRVVLKEVGISVSHPGKFVLAVKHIIALHSIHSLDFHNYLSILLDQVHNSHMNPQLYKRLQIIRQAQADIRERKFTKEDEKAIQYIVSNFNTYRNLPLQVATMLLKKQYHSMKTSYLSRYPSRPIKAGNIVSGLRELYGYTIDK
jgi:hypothetical protein